MQDPLPIDIIVTETVRGVHYRLPPRQLGPYRYVGLALFMLALMLCSVLLFPAWKVIQSLRHPGPADEGMMWLMLTAFCFVFVVGGMALARIGLLILAGHSEVELRDGVLYASECWGPVRWTWDRPIADLRRLFVGEGLESLNFFGRVSIGPLGRLCVITPEWKAAVNGPTTKPMWLAPGYPKPWLLALAGELARRCASLAELTGAPPAPVTIPVLQQQPDFSEFEELAEQPAGSRITVEETAGGIRWTVPGLGLRHNIGLVLAGAFVCFVAFGIAQTMFMDDAARGHSLTTTLSIAAFASVAGIALLLAAASRARRSAVLTVVDGTFTVRQSNLFGTRQRQWLRRQIADVFVMHYPDSENDDHWELQIHPYPGEGEAFHLLARRDVAELRWLATALRRTLQCTGRAERSPPPGLVVSSPHLVLRFRGARSQVDGGRP